MKGLLDTVITNNSDLKQQLINYLKQETVDFKEIAERFYQQEYHSEEDYLALTDAIINATDRVLNADHWEDSLFLRNALKPIKQLREQALLVKKEATVTLSDPSVTLRPLADNEQLVYISLFQSEGHDLRKWAIQLSTLSHHVLSRPVYEKEEDVVAVIRKKLIQVSEAFVIVAVKKQEVQPIALHSERVDRLGNVLLTLKDTAVKTENIFEFVHQQQRYFFVNGQLVVNSEGT